MPYDHHNPTQRVEVWSLSPVSLRSQFKDAKYACLINVSAPQDRAGAALACGIRDLLLAAKPTYGSATLPEVVAMSHLIRGTQHFGFLLFDSRAKKMYRKAVSKGSELETLPHARILTAPLSSIAPFLGDAVGTARVCELWRYDKHTHPDIH